MEDAALNSFPISCALLYVPFPYGAKRKCRKSPLKSGSEYTPQQHLVVPFTPPPTLSEVCLLSKPTININI